MFGLFTSLFGLAAWKVGEKVLDKSREEERVKRFGVYNEYCKHNRGEQSSVLMEYCTQPRVKEVEYLTRKELYELAKKELKRRGYDWNTAWDKEMMGSFVPDNQLFFDVGRKKSFYEQELDLVNKIRNTNCYVGYAPTIQDVIINNFFNNNVFPEANLLYLEMGYVSSKFRTFAPLFWNKNIRNCYEMIIFAYDSLYDYKYGNLNKESISIEELSLMLYLFNLIKNTNETSPFGDEEPIDINGNPLKWHRTEEEQVKSISKLYVPFVKDYEDKEAMTIHRELVEEEQEKTVRKYAEHWNSNWSEFKAIFYKQFKVAEDIRGLPSNKYYNSY